MDAVHLNAWGVKGDVIILINNEVGEWGSGQAKCLKITKKSSKSNRFFVLNIQFWVQTNRSKDYLKRLYFAKKVLFGVKKRRLRRF